MKSYKNSTGFALPTVLMVSVIMLAVLTAAVASSVSIRNALQDQHYNRMARQAADSGTVYAQACIERYNGQITWSEEKPLRPNTDCNGTVQDDLSGYVVDTGELRTYFVVGVGNAGAINSQGYVEALRSSDGIAWRFWSANKVLASDAATDNTPVGTSIEGYWSTAPNGYLLEDGSAVSRTEYAELFGVIGTTFGSGDGSTTFNLPDSRGRVTVNINTSDSDFDSIGEKRGAKTHTLTDAQVPNTTVRSTNSSTKAFRATSGQYNIGGIASGLHYVLISGGESSMAGELSVQGGGGSHNIIQPSIVVTRAIKY